MTGTPRPPPHERAFERIADERGGDRAPGTPVVGSACPAPPRARAGALRALGASWVLAGLFVAPVARADALPPPEAMRCHEGFVVAYDHGGTSCVRPSCDVTADCPADLSCTPRRCLAATTLPDCLEELGGAKEPPDPCRGIEDRGPCAADASCPEGAWCSRGTCLPADELAAYVEALPRDSSRAAPDPSTEPAADRPGTDPRRPTPPGGGCCGSRGARASASALLSTLTLGLLLARRRRGRRAAPSARR